MAKRNNERGCSNYLCVTDILSMGCYHSRFVTEYIASRAEGYFIQAMGVKNEYIGTLEEIRQNGDYRKIGIKLDGHNVEYPILALTGVERKKVK